MYNDLKKEIEKDFDKQKNYNIILSKVEGGESMKNFKLRYALISLCVVVIAVIGIKQTDIFNKNKEKVAKSGGNWTIKEVYVDDLYAVEDQLGIALRWEEKTISQQFPTVEYNNNDYDSKHGEISIENIGESLGNAVLEGYDTYNKETHTHNATLYTIKTISNECAIAVQFEGTSEYYAYTNAYYRPETLGDFINDLNLKETISFGSVWYDDKYTDENGNFHIDDIEFPNVSKNAIWSMLFSDTSLENVFTDNTTGLYPAIISVSVDIPILGYKNISCWLTENGYLCTNILDTGKGFYIGEEKVKEFVDYVINNYEGIKTVYVDKDGNRSDEYYYEDEEDAGDDIILTMSNETGKEEIYSTGNTTSSGNVTYPNTGTNVISHSID